MPKCFCRSGSATEQRANTSLVKIQGLEDSKDANFYFGKRVAYVYKAKTKKNVAGGASNTKFRVSPAASLLLKESPVPQLTVSME